MNITWSIENLERKADDGFVIVAGWRVNAVDGDHNAGAYGSVGFEYHDDFKPFNQLTQDEVIGWVKAQLDVEAIESRLAEIIADEKNPKVIAGVPW